MKKTILMSLYFILIVISPTWIVKAHPNKGKQTSTIIKKELQQTKNLFHNKKNRSIGMANPASIKCEKTGGVLKMEQTPKGTIGVCYFKNNKQCEEWALFRNECPKDGVDVTNYSTSAARYCAITGGKYQTKSGWVAKVQSYISKEQGTCKLPNGETCDVWKFWNGNCPKISS